MKIFKNRFDISTLRCNTTLSRCNLCKCRTFIRIFPTALTTRQGWICTVDRQTVKFTNTSAS